LISAGKEKECHSWEEFADLIKAKNPELASAFLAATTSLQGNTWMPIYPEWANQTRIHEKLHSGESISYLDLPLSLALETNSKLATNPWK
jgi:hypothetical protein